MRQCAIFSPVQRRRDKDRAIMLFSLPARCPMTNKAKQIESFYWMLIRIGAVAFGYLMMLGGGLLALAFAVEKWRTGAVAFGGANHPDFAAAFFAIGLPTAVAVSGLVLVRVVRRLPRSD